MGWISKLTGDQASSDDAAGEREQGRVRVRRVVDPQTGRVVTERAVLYGEAVQVAPGLRMVPGKTGGKKKNKKKS
ncbi:hypothetical protein ABT354_05530 [Streptomyces sp. NPDC000594]|uniref:hypothetical protein n=1 Tax=Streptomyces sp. NPDC000594 TaxID=3154261 RepID=UPI003328EBBE